MNGIIKKMGDIVGGLFLLCSGIFLLFLYFVVRKMADNWFISFLMLLFLVGLGLGGIILGIKRIIFTAHERRNNFTGSGPYS